MSSETAVRVENLYKRFPVRRGVKQMLLHPFSRPQGRFALNGVDFEIMKGESVGIVGVNGSGKSTLLQILAGTMAPTSGRAVVNGTVGAILELGAGFHPEFTGRENARLGLTLADVPACDIAAKLAEVEAFADIGSYIDMPVRTYSSGMYVRLAFSTAVAGRPDILIVDEALAVGDASFQRRCYEKMSSIKRDGGTLIFVSHDEEAVRTLTDRAVLLDKGDQIAVGPSDEIAFMHRRRMLQSKPSTTEGSGDKSFGEDWIRNLRCTVIAEDGAERVNFDSGERVALRVSFEADREIVHPNVGLRIRTSTGVKVFSWGTMNRDCAVGRPEDGFWGTTVAPGLVEVEFGFECRLGHGAYEVQLIVSEEPTSDYLNQKVLRWTDSAAVFHVGVDPRRERFGGFFDLRPDIVHRQIMEQTA
ncbi:ABC transporter ATP-binding protein [Rhizobium leguminosarum]|uniref:ABC transporter ATP-binding protein n=1 Tax=Rhizobium leguminosarum TaxID=384 RepID=UPI002E159219|nr:ABC transporter ATP-binding protein [Rhizobium leguminosarum]